MHNLFYKLAFNKYIVNMAVVTQKVAAIKNSTHGF